MADDLTLEDKKKKVINLIKNGNYTDEDLNKLLDEIEADDRDFKGNLKELLPKLVIQLNKKFKDVEYSKDLTPSEYYTAISSFNQSSNILNYMSENLIDSELTVPSMNKLNLKSSKLQDMTDSFLETYLDQDNKHFVNTINNCKSEKDLLNVSTEIKNAPTTELSNDEKLVLLEAVKFVKVKVLSNVYDDTHDNNITTDSDFREKLLLDAQFSPSMNVSFDEDGTMVEEIASSPQENSTTVEVAKPELLEYKQAFASLLAMQNPDLLIKTLGKDKTLKDKIKKELGITGTASSIEDKILLANGIVSHYNETPGLYNTEEFTRLVRIEQDRLNQKYSDDIKESELSQSKRINNTQSFA